MGDSALRNGSAGRVYCVGRFVLDMRRGALFRDGEELRLRPKCFEVLSYLVANAGRLVSREELLRSLWGSAVVTDDSVTQCVVTLRKAMGDGGHEIIRTVPRRGYILDVPVTSAPASGASSKVPLAPGSGPAPRSIVVLPFLDISRAADQQYLADGLVEEILDRLAQLPGLRVVARASAEVAAAEHLDVPTLAGRFGVDAVLEGSVRRADEVLRVSVQLIDALEDAHLWAAIFEHPVGSEFALEDEIATQVARALDVALFGASTSGKDVNL